MPALEYPDQATVDTWGIEERGLRDGSSPNERFEVNSSGTTRTVFCKWEYRADVIKWFLGYAETWDDGGTTRLSRLLPLRHPAYPSLAATRVTNVKGHKWIGNANPDVDGHYQFSGTQINVWKHAEIEIQYDHVAYEMRDDADILDEIDRYVTRGETTPTAEYLGLPGATLKYVRPSGAANPHGVAIPFNTGKILPTEQFILTWERVPENVWKPGSGLYELVYGTGIDETPYLGCVNDSPFYGRPAGTVLFSGVRPILQRSPLGNGFEFALEYVFTFDPRMHNHKMYYGLGGATADNGWYLVGKTATYYAPADIPDNHSIYNVRDLSYLFDVNN